MGKFGRLALAFFVGTLALSIPIGILGSSNLVWGEPNQYGKIPVPGHDVLRFPSGTVDVAVAAILVGRGNETPSFPLPSDLTLTVIPVEGSAEPTVVDSVGAPSNAMADDADTLRRVWRIEVPSDGDYRVAARGTFGGAFVDPQMWFGHGPPLPGELVPVIAAALTLIGIVVWVVVMPRIRKRRRGAKVTL